MRNPFIKNRVKKLYRDESRKAVYHNWNEIRTVLVLFDTREYEEADLFIDQLIAEGKSVKVFAYKDKKDEYDYSETPYTIIHSKEVNDWFDSSKLEEAGEKIGEYHYDLLIDLSISKNLVFDFLIIHADADLKTGYRKIGLSPYDLAITNLPEASEGEGRLFVRELAKQIRYYLESIKS